MIISKLFFSFICIPRGDTLTLPMSQNWCFVFYCTWTLINVWHPYTVCLLIRVAKLEKSRVLQSNKSKTATAYQCPLGFLFK